jgi:hypothetical protein
VFFVQLVLTDQIWLSSLPRKEAINLTPLRVISPSASRAKAFVSFRPSGLYVVVLFNLTLYTELITIVREGKQSPKAVNVVSRAQTCM